MKHRFLLDENILYFAINGIDEHDRPDETSTELIRRIGANCHKIVINRLLAERYWVHLRNIERERKPSRAYEPVAFINQLLKNSEKLLWEPDELPELPVGVEVPAEDLHIVRFALLARTTIVSGDAELRVAVNRSPALGLKALSPTEALVPAADS